MEREKVASTQEKPVGQVRWLLRNGERILQQYFAVTSYSAGGTVLGLHGEWRDVPIEDETTGHQ